MKEWVGCELLPLSETRRVRKSGLNPAGLAGPD